MSKNDPTTIRASIVLAAIEELTHQIGVIAEVQTEHSKKLEKLDIIEERVNQNTDDIKVIKNILGKHSEMHQQNQRDHKKMRQEYLTEHKKIRQENQKEHEITRKEIKKLVHRTEFNMLEQRVAVLEK